MVTKKLSISEITNNDGCFDLQFRKDTRHERTNSPTYYRWKAQFVITQHKSEIKSLEKIQQEFGCGAVSISGTQARFAVQKIDDISKTIIPYFTKNQLVGKKKNDFQLWTKAADILQRNKGVTLAGWKKSDICQLIAINRSASKYKNRSRPPKWLDVAKGLSKCS